MKNLSRFLSLVLVPATGELRSAETWVVEEGRPRAEIVIGERPPRSTRLAAQELRDQVERMSGARLPIVTQPTGGVVKLYVGQSAHTEALGLSLDGLEDGAYRLVSGPDWLVFLGDDTDFVPIEPWARNNADIVSGKLQAEWDRITGDLWGAPYPGMYKHRLKLPGSTGLPDGTEAPAGQMLELWGFDERGSFNAVCGWLESLGMRWYLPGELGQVTPVLRSIPLPAIDETVRPDFPLRRINFRFGVVGPETARWAMRLGLRDPYGIQVAHGLETMTGRDEIFARRPEWFALYGGKRHYTPGYSKNQLCYSNEELFRHAVRYARAQFDHYGLETVSIMPPDGYTSICQCEKCAGKDSPERDDRGLLSDYVWDFVNRVAKEVGKTHPDRRILNCAYGVYTLPPLKIDKLEPNVQVCIVGGRRPLSDRPEEQAEIRKLREAWDAKTDQPLLIFENYPFTDRGWYLPSYFPTVLGESINATKGISAGEDIWLTVAQDFHERGIAINHFLVYFTAKLWWGGPEREARALFDEYCRLFYGPAATEMAAFFAHCEAHWREMEKDKDKADAGLALFAAAKARAAGDATVAARVALIDTYLDDLRSKSEQLGKKRGPVPQIRLVGDAAGVVIDGDLGDAYWQKCPVSARGSLRELQTGRAPVFGTTFQMGWQAGSLCLAIRCAERPGDKPNDTATKDDDAAIFYGDAVEILIETAAHGHYQIVVSPSGRVVDLDRQAGKRDFRWDSQAEVATRLADDHWVAEIRIPVTQDENDPLHQVIGRKPTQSLPWYVNVCRQRVRENGQEHSAFSPTGTAGFHEPIKFAHLFDGRSHAFEADPTVTDYVIASRAADDLLRRRQTAEALAAYEALAAGEVTDYQRADALSQAAAAARTLGDFAKAEALADRIPIEAVEKATRMENRLAERRAPDLLRDYGAEDIGAWPFWKAGEGYAARGRAHAILKAGPAAEADLVKALEWTGEPRRRASLWLALGQNREHTLNDDPGALAAYREVVRDVARIGGSDEFNALQGAARVLVRRGDPAEAVATLQRVDLGQQKGHWLGSMALALGDALRAAGKTAEAAAAYRAAFGDASVEPGHRQAAESRLADLKPDR